MARSGGRLKYEAVSLIDLGRALTAQGLAQEAIGELTGAVAAADQLGSPLFRWEARAALAAAKRAAGVDPEPHLAEAARIIREVASSLAPDRARAYLAAPQVREVLELT
jgi:hypothetical protein